MSNTFKPAPPPGGYALQLSHTLWLALPRLALLAPSRPCCSVGYLPTLPCDDETHMEPAPPSCFYCSLLPAPGTTLPAYDIMVAADASVKPCHYSSAGRAQSQVAPCSHTFLGSVSEEVQARFKAGELTSEAQQQYACAAADAGVEGCSSNLTCSRASASARGVVDIAGCTAVVCAHCFPLLNCVVAMPAPEQWAFHISGLTEALTRRPDIRHICIDIGCRIGSALLDVWRKLAGHAPPLLSMETVEQAS